MNNNERETTRLETLHSLQILDTLPEYEYDAIVALACRLCDTPMASISLVDKDRQWFKSEIGLMARETPRSISFCKETILRNRPLIVEDASLDDRFKDSPLVTCPNGIRFYAGVPLNVLGENIGALCALDYEPRTITSGQLDSLQVLANLTASIIVKSHVSREYRELASTIRHLPFGCA